MRDVSDGEYWDLEIQKVHRGEDGLAAIVDTGITPRERLDEIEKTFFPAKGRVTPAPVISVEMLEADYAGYVLSFDGAAKPSTRQGSCGCVIWKLPGWRIPTAQGFLLEDATVNRSNLAGRSIDSARDGVHIIAGYRQSDASSHTQSRSRRIGPVCPEGTRGIPSGTLETHQGSPRQ
ncbi:hypothetical protein PC121_g15325 [Phytophthora cactorum]|nr:hypothetical protein PC120_g17424 [Phytophthora cactorum]KAG3056398.1 hypothetical protein PC121_g15325 [Phytophthora cactorum]